MGKLNLDVLLNVLHTPYVQHTEALIPHANIGTLLEAVDVVPFLAEADGIALPRAKNCVLHVTWRLYFIHWEATMKGCCLRHLRQPPLERQSLLLPGPFHWRQIGSRLAWQSCPVVQLMNFCRPLSRATIAACSKAHHLLHHRRRHRHRLRHCKAS